MKKYISIIMSVLLAAVMFSACSTDKESDKVPETGDKLKIVTTIFPEYDWVREILGSEFDNTEVTMLLDNGVDMHSYQPTADDIIKISTCDMFVYIGGESDKWVENALAEAINKDIVAVNLLDIIGDAAKAEEIVEGMEADEKDDESNEIEYDEHIWLSLKNARTICAKIAEMLGEIDNEHKDIYLTNCDNYIKRLTELDNEYKKVVSDADVKTVLFGDRFPFRYMIDDYGLSYYAAFSGCSAETEAGFETIIFLASKADELNLNAIIQLESSDGKIADTIRQNTRLKTQKILTLDSMQSTTSADIKNGTTYLSVMEKNLEGLKEALN